jgi:glycosidase
MKRFMRRSPARPLSLGSRLRRLLPLLAAGGLGSACTRPERPWQVGATCYEIFVRSFADSDGDGIGDLNGLTARLDHLNDADPATTDDLGVRCVWLMPVAESPGYHGYDVSDPYAVEKDYGSSADFKRFVEEAHRRGIRVLVDLVLNHVSSEHPAFQAALRDTASPYREWFRFQPEKGPLNRWGGDNWHASSERAEFYYGFFWKGMPDLDYTRPAALEEMKRVASFWLTDMRVDGFRLDAVKYLVRRTARPRTRPERTACCASSRRTCAARSRTRSRSARCSTARARCSPTIPINSTATSRSRSPTA